MRGGTSKGLIFRRDDLPADRQEWAGCFLAALGSPDRHGRQLDGMGGGVSSLSKICVVNRSERADADVDYTFAQVSVTEPMVDFGVTCGNMAAAIGPFAVDEGLVQVPADDPAVIRIFHTNSGRIILSSFDVVGGEAAVEGDFAIDGVSGTAAPIRLEFVDPGGALTGSILPTGNPTDSFDLGAGRRVAATLIDAGIPSVFARASDLGWTVPSRRTRSQAKRICRSYWSDCGGWLPSRWDWPTPPRLQPWWVACPRSASSRRRDASRRWTVARSPRPTLTSPPGCYRWGCRIRLCR
jgi:2-methylaconitate isomerase